MDRTDRVLAMWAGSLSPLEALRSGVTLQDADDALSLATLDLELTTAAHRPTMREMVSEWLRAQDEQG